VHFPHGQSSWDESHLHEVTVRHFSFSNLLFFSIQFFLSFSTHHKKNPFQAIFSFAKKCAETREEKKRKKFQFFFLF